MKKREYQLCSDFHIARSFSIDTEFSQSPGSILASYATDFAEDALRSDDLIGSIWKHAEEDMRKSTNVRIIVLVAF